MRKFLFLLAFLCLLVTISAHSQVTTPLALTNQFFDNDGNPLNGGLLYSYSAGTSTPLATYTTSVGNVQNTNPVVLDSAGRASVWLGSNSYKLVLKSSDGSVTYWTQDNVNNFLLLSRTNTWTGANTFNGTTTFNGTATFNAASSFTAAVSTSAGVTNTESGSFTNANCFYGVLSNIGGGTPCTIFHSSQGAGNYSTEAVTGVVTNPIGSTNYQTDAVSGLAVDNSGTTNTVALYGYAQCNVANGKCWGANPAVQAAAGAINTNIQGMEVDVNIQTGATGATARGINVSMPIAHATPSLSQGVSVNAGNSDGVLWDYGFATQRAAATTGLFLDSLASTASTASQPIVLRGHDGGNVSQDASIQASNVGNLNLTPATGENVVITAGSLGFGSSNVPFIASNGSGGLRLITTNSQSVTFEHSGVQASVSSTGKGTFASYATNNNCTSVVSPAVCGSAAAGSVVIAAGVSNVVVQTSTVTANSQIFIQEDSSLGARLGVTCNATAAYSTVVGRNAGIDFTIETTSAPVTDPRCFSYFIVN